MSYIYSDDILGSIFNSILGIVSIIIFSFSIYKSKRCIEAATLQNYNSAKGLNTASIVFFVICCLRFIYSAIMLLVIIVVLINGLLYDVFVEELWILIQSSVSVAAFILGIVALAKFSKAKTFYFKTHPMPAPNYYRGNPYSYQNQYQYPQNGASPNQDPYQNQYPYQQNNPYQNQNPYYQNNPYQNPYFPQNNAPQAPLGYKQATPYEAPPEITSAADFPVASDSNTASIGLSDNDSPTAEAVNNIQSTSPTDSKPCPHCGVTNAGQNKFCTFCGKGF